MKFRFDGTPRVRFPHPTRTGITVDLTLQIGSIADLNMDKSCGITECELPDYVLRDIFEQLARTGALTIIERAR